MTPTFRLNATSLDHSAPPVQQFTRALIKPDGFFDVAFAKLGRGRSLAGALFSSAAELQRAKLD